MKICIDCVYFKPSNFGETKFHQCSHPDCRHPVSGTALHCVDLRKSPKPPCGSEGSLYEERRTPLPVRKMR